MSVRRPLFVFETPADVPDLAGHPELAGGRDGSGARLLALEPALRARLQERGLEATGTDIFFSGEDHAALLRELEPLMEVLDGFGLEDPAGLREPYRNTVTFYGRFLAAYLLWFGRVLARACAAEPVERLVVGPGRDRPTGSPQMTQEDRLARGVAETVAQTLGVGVVPSRPESRPADPGRSWLRPLAEAARRLLFRVGSRALAGTAGRGGAYLLVLSDHYGLDRVVEGPASSTGLKVGFAHHSRKVDALRHGHPFLVLPREPRGREGEEFDRRLRRATEDLCAELRRDPELLSVAEASLVESFIVKFRAGIVPALRRLFAESRALDAHLRSTPPAAVVSQQGRGLGTALGELARRRGIPSLLITHGSHVPPTDGPADLEWRWHAEGFFRAPYDRFAVQTRLARKALEAEGRGDRGVSTGPLIFTEVRDRAGTDRKGPFEIVHAGTPKHCGYLRPLVYQTADEYVANINRLVDVVDRVEGYRLTVRFRPTQWLSEAELRVLLRDSPKFTLECGGSFADTLRRADLLVAFSSTTLEEALVSGVPVLQFDADDRYQHVPARRLPPDPVAPSPEPSAAYYVGRTEDLAPALDWIRDHHLMDPEAGVDFEEFRLPAEECVPLAEVLDELRRGRGGSVGRPTSAEGAGGPEVGGGSEETKG